MLAAAAEEYQPRVGDIFFQQLKALQHIPLAFLPDEPRRKRYHPVGAVEFFELPVKLLFRVLAGFIAVDDIICRKELVFVSGEQLLAFFLHLEGVKENIAPAAQRKRIELRALDKPFVVAAGDIFFAFCAREGESLVGRVGERVRRAYIMLFYEFSYSCGAFQHNYRALYRAFACWQTEVNKLARTVEPLLARVKDKDIHIEFFAQQQGQSARKPLAASASQILKYNCDIFHLRLTSLHIFRSGRRRACRTAHSRDAPHAP